MASNEQEEEGEEEFRHLLCPIMQEIMTDPVSLLCGHSFERQGIADWLQGRNTCPVCRTVLPTKRLQTNYGLRGAIEAYLKKQPHLAARKREEKDFRMAVRVFAEMQEARDESVRAKREAAGNTPPEAGSAVGRKGEAQLVEVFLKQLGLEQYT